MFNFLKKHRAVKKLISSNEKAEITAKCNFLFAGGNAGKDAFFPTHTAFLEEARGNRSVANKERFPRKYFIFAFFHSPTMKIKELWENAGKIRAFFAHAPLLNEKSGRIFYLTLKAPPNGAPWRKAPARPAPAGRPRRPSRRGSKALSCPGRNAQRFLPERP